MGELTVQQEIDMLQQIIATHQLAADELADIEEQIYDLQKQQQDETLAAQKDAVQETYDKIVQALKNRLQEEKDAELAAIDEKIAALQDAGEAEKEEQRKTDYEENLAEKQAQLRRTKSARERRELQKEIDDMIAAEAQRQADIARQDQIDALRDEKTAVQDKYAELTEEENLRQEALRLVMSGNLQAMSDLIESYGPKWEDAGALLADYLTQGIAGPNGLATGMQGILDSIKTSFYDYLGGLAGEAVTGKAAGILATINGMQDAVQKQFDLIGSTIPNINTRGGITINMYGLTVREEADTKRIAEEVMDEVDRRSR
jgi:hypothetical protein